MEQRDELKAAVPGYPSQAGIDLSNWNWKVVRWFVEERFGLKLSRSSCLNYLHRLGFVLKRPKKRLVKADPVRREAFVSGYAALTAAAQRTGAKIFFADEAHFRAVADLRGKWVLKGEPALVDSTSPRRGEKVSYYSAVCLETGEVMELEGNSNAATSAAFLKQLRARHPEPLTVIWDNSPAHRGDALRAYLATPDLNLLLVHLPSYSPDFNADEAIWGWARQEATANLCLGVRAAVQEKVGDFFARLSSQHPPPRKCRFHLGSSLGSALVRSVVLGGMRSSGHGHHGSGAGFHLGDDAGSHRGPDDVVAAVILSRDAVELLHEDGGGCAYGRLQLGAAGNALGHGAHLR